MRLFDGAGYGVDLRVVGYQFPEPDDPMHFSWHVVEGTAVSRQGTWTFRYPALTCDESPRLSAWLRAAADFTASGESSNRLDPPFFMEPNLTVAPDGWTDDATVLKIGLDLEFSPPWQRRTSAGDPFVIVIEPTREQVRQAAEEWDAEIAPYPDDHAK